MGPQGVSSNIFLIDQYNFDNNGFCFVYRTSYTEASILRCHKCPELPLNVITVHVNSMVHFGNTVKLDNLAPSSNLHPKMVLEDFYKDFYCWEHYNEYYTDDMRSIIGKLYIIQDDLYKISNCSDTALVDFVYDSNNTNSHANCSPDCITEDDLDFCRENFSDDTLSDFNFPQTKIGLYGYRR